MALKVYKKNNYIYLIDGGNDNKLHEGKCTDVLVKRTDIDGTNYSISGLMGWNRSVALAELENENGIAYTATLWEDFYTKNTGESALKTSDSGNTIVDLSNNDLGRDAWGIPKVSINNSIFHGMFTYNIPVSSWYETINGVIGAAFVNCSSVDGSLIVTAGATLSDKTNLKTYRNPRYEPNRGFLYSTAAIIELPNGLMNRSFGTSTAQSGVFFRLESGTLWGVIRTTRGGVTTEDKIPLDITGIDLSKGNVYDIQYQWRGVGNYVFFINLQEVGNSNYLGTLTELSMSNPASPLFFESENLGDNYGMTFGCVDVTAEGGKANGKTYGSISIDNEPGEVSIAGYNVPILAVRSKLTAGSLINTRDTLALLASAYSDQRAMIRIWATRDFTAITENDQVWKDYGDGHLEFLEYNNPVVATAMTFDIAKANLIFGSRVAIDQSYATSALFEGRTSIFLTPGDLFIFTMHRENGLAANVGVTFEFAEEI